MVFTSDDGPIFEATDVGDETEIITREEAERAYQEAKDDADGYSIPPTFKVRVLAGRFRLAHSDAIAKRGDVLKINQPGNLNPYGQPMKARVDALPSDGGKARMLVRRTGFDLSLDPVAEFLSAQEGEQTADIPAASDGYENFSAVQDLIADGALGTILSPPGRADQIAIRAVSRDNNSFSATFAFDQTDLTFNSDSSYVIDEVLPVYYIDDVGFSLTDTSGGANNTVEVDLSIT
jgi:hypothetical protein